MKLLVLTSRFPFPLEKGDKLRIFHQIRELSRHHDIVLCALSEHPISAEDYAQLAPYCSTIKVIPLSKIQIIRNVISGLLRGLPIQVAYFYNPRWQQDILTLVAQEQPTHLYCQLIRMSEYAKSLNLPKVLDFMDAFSVGLQRRLAQSPWFLRSFLQFEHARTQRYEQKIQTHFGATTMISAQDSAIFSAATAPIVVPNGVDTAFFDRTALATVRQYDIVFVGNMGYYPNRQAAKFLVHKILPLLKIHKPDIKVLIAGARPAADIQALASPQVTVSGWLADIREAYAASAVFVAPLFLGSGQQNKILEAMSMQCPCVTTPLVNNAIGAQPDHDILLADTAKTFAEQILFLLENPEKQEIIGQNGHFFVKKTYSWTTTTAALADLIVQQKR